MKTKRILLNSRPQGMPDESNFEFDEQEISGLEEGQLLLKSLYISVDPYMRGRMNDTRSYVPPYKVNEPITGGIVAEVVECRNKKYKKGDVVMGNLPWQTFILSDGNGLTSIDPDLAPLSYHLGILGMPGLTAYCGLLFIGEPKEGETVVVSGAAGAVGTVVGQIAKQKGCRVVGIAGTDEKVAYLKNELGFDEGINYKTTSNIKEALEKACPDGVDVYFDNVGGSFSDAVYTLLNKYARIVVCGQIALYNSTSRPTGPRVEPILLTKSCLMKGFIVSDYADRFGEAAKELVSWVKTGKLQYEESITDGFDNLPEAFLGLFKGENTGKQLVKVADRSIQV
ncbi:leukotriene B4 12-hydroxydehydrogenase/15-oxo-prostaglandin 13-reductase [Pontibacter aydingkolensis]|uniref:NADP-dependent oxidoreductase n=1 Tax=Pontibacter aydingkolensis TaxID=1911536 RepID=A0ABS7CXD6_9BACT|nr:NADP-dependent oxidoreductase [Pontibacter aydingkolensis]MBW7468499.1 NADP-dependent oxidoreductase [Pontibacter aydingkolensis]